MVICCSWLTTPPSLSWNQWSRKPATPSPSQHSPLGSKSSGRPVSKHACSYVATNVGEKPKNIATHFFSSSSSCLYISGYSLYIVYLIVNPLRSSICTLVRVFVVAIVWYFLARHNRDANIKFYYYTRILYNSDKQ